MIVDAHQHFWNKDRFDYPWLTPETDGLYRNFEPEDLQPLAEVCDVENTIVVQCMSSVEETKWLLELSEKSNLIGGVVGWVDLQSDILERDLSELQRFEKLKSVRHQIEDEQDREWLLQKSVLRGLKIVSEHGLKFDALLKHDQLWQLKSVVDACPELGIVIDHSAKPDIKNREFDVWAKNIADASKLPVNCKLSGLFTEAEHKTWKTEDIRKYSDFVLKCFGPERVMFGSDWPVSTLASDYRRTIRTTVELCSDLSEEDRHLVFFLNAREFYRIS